MSSQQCCPVDEEERLRLDVELLGTALPPFTKPDLARMRSEASGGISLVGCLIITFMGITFGMSGSCTPETRSALTVTVVSLAVTAIACLSYILMGDPGVVRRTQDACLPLPAEVAEKLSVWNPQDPAAAVGHPLDGMNNIKEPERSYCVRCCLWRHHNEELPRRGRIHRAIAGRQVDTVKFHHCSTCQRCVRHFDHHCGVLGRCIAGRGLSGNMPCFIMLIMCAYAGTICAGAAVVLGILQGAIV